MKTCFVYMTCRDKDEARAIGRHLVTSGTAACVNIIDHMNSLYIWDGELQDDQETVMIAKTTAAKAPDLVAAVKERHSYDCPCIAVLPIEDGNPEFLSWIAQQVAS